MKPEVSSILPGHSQGNGKDSKRVEGLVTSMVDALRLSKNYRHLQFVARNFASTTVIWHREKTMCIWPS